MTDSHRIEIFNIERSLLDSGFDWKLEYDMLMEEIKEFKLANSCNDKDEMIDALCDIIVVATGSMLKLGYNPTLAMDETLKEIEDRTGSINIETGKWMKKTRGNEYKAKYWRCENG